jgi:hypothetical protein
MYIPSDVVSIAQVVAVIVVSSALIYTARTFRRVGKTQQIKMAESVYKDLKQLEKELSDFPYEVDNPTKTTEAKKHWDSRLFNTLEWYAFLVNKNEIKDKSIIKYFKDTILDYYEDNFQADATAEQISDPEEYPEFKQLYQDLKIGKFKDI